MGQPTDYLGHVDVVPPLNADERDCLHALGDAWGPNDVAAEGAGPAPSRLSRSAGEPPGQRCPWQPCADGCCLSLGEYDASEPAAWLRYLIRHFLRPGAVAQGRGRPRFAGFSFDHRLDGLVVGCRRDDKGLFAIRVADNRVSERILRVGDRRHLEGPDPVVPDPALPTGGLRAPAAGRNVIDLASRRRR